jgi:hypothetical protein
MKTCNKCEVEKELAEFHKNKASKSGHRGICKACVTLSNKVHYEANKEVIAVKGRKYRSENREARLERVALKNKEYYEANKEVISVQQKQYRSENSELLKERVRKYRKANPDKDRAHAAVKRAVHKGTLIKQPCEKCGGIDADAHHDDYTKPLEVQWLCRKHHSEWHTHNTPIRAPEYL